MNDNIEVERLDHIRFAYEESVYVGQVMCDNFYMPTPDRDYTLHYVVTLDGEELLVESDSIIENLTQEQNTP